MIDAADEVAFWTPLPLAECAAHNGAFFAVDAEALKNQGWHRRLAVAAALCGRGAVLIAVWVLGFGSDLRWLPGPLNLVEVALVAVGFVAIGMGLCLQRKNRWLLNRHKAEMLRLVKFEFLTTPSVWAGGELSGTPWVSDKVRAVEAVRDRQGLEEAVSASKITGADSSPRTTPCRSWSNV